METFILFAVAFWLGWSLHGIVIRSMIRTALRSAGIDPKDLEAKLRAAMDPSAAAEEDSKIKATVKVERMGDVLYAYEHPTDRFLGQHTDPKELLKIIADKFPTGTDVTVPKELGAEYLR